MREKTRLRWEEMYAKSLKAHVKEGGRLATCPHCDRTIAVPKTSKETSPADAVQWTCVCGENILASAVPTKADDKMRWTGARANPDDPYAWGHVRLYWLRKTGCSHPLDKRHRNVSGYYCSACGASWDFTSRRTKTRAATSSAPVETAQKINKELLQVSSKIVADINNWEENIGTILDKLTPAGSITGTPKRKTVEILKEIENYNRGFYTGIFGIFDGKKLISSVTIRYIEKENNNLFYKSGGGITLDSNLKLEYQELIDKVAIPNF